MEWTGEGLIIGVRRHGESSVIAEAMVQGRGRHLGLVRGGRSSRLVATLQPGNSVQLTWRARIEDNLGTYAIELLQGRAANIIADRTRLYACQLLCEHLRLLPERDAHDRLLFMALNHLDGAIDAAALARFELFLLDELGFGLDLDSCAVTGVNDGLTHVSPKTGRAVCASAAEPYLDRLLRLPPFLISDEEPTGHDLRDAFKLTGHFLDMHVWSVRDVAAPATREALIEILLK